MSLESQDIFNDHIQKILSIKGRRIDARTFDIKELSSKDEAELKRLKASIPVNENILNLIEKSGSLLMDKNNNNDLPQKVKIDKENKEFDPRNPQIVLGSLEDFLEKDDDETLKDYLKVSPWTLTELRRYAKTDPRFKSILSQAEEKGVQASKSKAPIVKKKVSVKKRELTASELKRIEHFEARVESANLQNSKCNLFEVEKSESGEVSINIFRDDLSTHDSYRDASAKTMEVTGCSDIKAGVEILARVGIALESKHNSQEQFCTRINAIARLMAEFGPRDALEGCLCAQGIVFQEKGAHLMAMADRQNDPEWAKINYAAANKLPVLQIKG